MEAAALLSKLDALAGKMILERQKFGRTGDPCVWIEARAVPAFGRILRDNRELAFDWLEAVSAMQDDGALVLTYVVRSYRLEHTLIFRASVVPRSAQEEAEFPSVRSVWPMATSFESEIRDLFGFQFVSSDGNPVPIRSSILPAGWRGFPLRKDYIFPTEVYGVFHARPRSNAPDDARGGPS